MPVTQAVEKRIREHLAFIYKTELVDDFVEDYLDLIRAFESHMQPAEKWDEKDVLLITYGDSIQRSGEKPLATLNSFLQQRLSDISCVHILPFFPYSSDDGFSVIDYETVDPDLGDWEDIRAIHEKFDLQIDLVINHASQHSDWFKKYLRGVSPEAGYFIDADPQADLSAVVRPRSLPLLTGFNTANGPKWLWTTFSSDQIDLNFANPRVLYEMTRILLLYIKMGARAVRLDAIAFLWKRLGTTCLHLPETHHVVKLFRTIFDAVDPRLILLTETNVPNSENLSYFGGNDEAHMVYQFSLPPLLLHALHTGTARHLTSWAKQLPDLPPENTFFNFTASHDGIGVRPLEGLLKPEAIQKLCNTIKLFGGHVSTKNNADGSTSPYEINISLFDAFKGDENGVDEWGEARFLCSQTIMLALRGIPAFYIHSLLATPNWDEGVQQTGQNRSINRRKWDVDELQTLLQGGTVHSRVFDELVRRIRIRKNESAFHPSADQCVLEIQPELFVFQRKMSNNLLTSISNVTKTHIVVNLSEFIKSRFHYVDILAERKCNVSSIHIKPFQTMWLKPASD